MKKLILHIGRNKSGTTAIQRFLKGNSDYLSEKGFYYPTTGIRRFAHHLIAEPMNPRRIRSDALRSPNSMPLLHELHKEIASATEKQIILSSEAFQSCHPGFIKEAFSPYQTRIVVYIRNQLDYVTSSYAQKVHANNYTGSLDDFFENDYKVDYLSFLNSWDNAFEHQLTVRRYSPEALEQNDVVSDFVAHALGDKSGGDRPFDRKQDANPSLNSKLVQFKLYLNREGYFHEESRNHLYRILPVMNDDFPSNSVRAYPALRDKMVSRCLSSNNMVAEKYFNDDQLFDFSTYQAIDFDPLDPGEIALMMTVLSEKLAEEGVSLNHFKKD